MKLSLGFKFNSVILIAFLLIALVFSVLYIPSLATRRAESVNGVVVLLETLVSRDHDHLAFELFDGRLRAVQMRLAEMLQVGEIRSISLYGPDGKYLLTAESDPGHPISSHLDRPDIGTGVTELILRREPLIRLDSVIALGDEPIGYLEILYSLAPVYAEQRRNLAVYIGLMGAMLILVLTVLNIFTARIVLRPIRLLAASMRAIQQEGPGLQMDARSDDEMGELAAAFNRMSAALEKSNRKITTQQKNLEESEEQYRTLFENAGDALVILDLDGKILTANQNTIDRYGYSAEELVGSDIRELVAPEKRSGVDERISITRDVSQILFESLHQTKSGTKIPVEVTAVVCEYRGRPAMLSILRDLRKRRDLEEQLRQSQKMEAIGLLAGGVAHDFSNLLTAILGYCDLIGLEEGLAESVRASLIEIKRAGKSAGSLIQQLLAFGRKQTLNPEVIILGGLVHQTQNMLSKLIGENINLEVKTDSDTKPIFADPGQLEQVLINLTVNARDAMPDGGGLFISIGNAELSEQQVSGEPDIGAGEYVRLVVRDTGAGIPGEIIDHIFDPFFSTKSIGRGTGLGLSTAYGIVKQSKGHITVQSEVGAGSLFEVFFPTVDRTPVTPEVDEFDKDPIRGTETILVVEDEGILRMMASNTLEKLGYTVIQAANGNEALEHFHADTGRCIDLLLSDVIMPELSGRELAGRIRVIYPEYPILFMTGYTEKLQDGRLDGIELLSKPFSAAELSDRVRQVLDS